jgi:hypothetical protein
VKGCYICPLPGESGKTGVARKGLIKYKSTRDSVWAGCSGLFSRTPLYMEVEHYTRLLVPLLDNPECRKSGLLSFPGRSTLYPSG